MIECLYVQSEDDVLKAKSLIEKIDRALQAVVLCGDQDKLSELIYYAERKGYRPGMYRILGIVYCTVIYSNNSCNRREIC